MKTIVFLIISILSASTFAQSFMADTSALCANYNIKIDQQHDLMRTFNVMRNDNSLSLNEKNSTSLQFLNKLTNILEQLVAESEAGQPTYSNLIHESKNFYNRFNNSNIDEGKTYVLLSGVKNLDQAILTTYEQHKSNNHCFMYE